MIHLKFIFSVLQVQNLAKKALDEFEEWSTWTWGLCIAAEPFLRAAGCQPPARSQCSMPLGTAHEARESRSGTPNQALLSFSAASGRLLGFLLTGVALA